MSSKKKSVQLFDIAAGKLLTKFAAGRPTPGSGSAAAFTGAVGAALIVTAGKLTSAKAKRGGELRKADAKNIAELAARKQSYLKRLASQDTVAFQKVIDARNAARKTRSPIKRAHLLCLEQRLLKRATEIVMRIAKECIELGKLGLILCRTGYGPALGEPITGTLNAAAAAIGSVYIASLNCKKLEQSVSERIVARAQEFLREALEIQREALGCFSGSSVQIDAIEDRQLRLL